MIKDRIGIEAYIFIHMIFMVVAHISSNFSQFVVLSKPSSHPRPTVCKSFPASILHARMHMFTFKLGLSIACYCKKCNEKIQTKVMTLIFLLKFLSFLFFMYLWIFLFLSSTEILLTLNVGSSKLEISDARAEVVVVVSPPRYRCWLSLLSPLMNRVTKITYKWLNEIKTNWG